MWVGHEGLQIALLQGQNLPAPPRPAPPHLSPPRFALGSAGVWYAGTSWKIECVIKLIKTILCVLIFLSSFN